MSEYSRGFAAGVEAAANAIDPGKWFVYTGPGGRDPEPILLKACERIRALAAPPPEGPRQDGAWAMCPRCLHENFLKPGDRCPTCAPRQHVGHTENGERVEIGFGGDAPPPRGEHGAPVSYGGGCGMTCPVNGKPPEGDREAPCECGSVHHLDEEGCCRTCGADWNYELAIWQDGRADGHSAGVMSVLDKMLAEAGGLLDSKPEGDRGRRCR